MKENREFASRSFLIPTRFNFRIIAFLPCFSGDQVASHFVVLLSRVYEKKAGSCVVLEG